MKRQPWYQTAIGFLWMCYGWTWYLLWISIGWRYYGFYAVDRHKRRTQTARFILRQVGNVRHPWWECRRAHYDKNGFMVNNGYVERKEQGK